MVLSLQRSHHAVALCRDYAFVMTTTVEASYEAGKLILDKPLSLRCATGRFQLFSLPGFQHFPGWQVPIGLALPKSI